MPEASVSADLLQDILEGRMFPNASSPEAELAVLARACRAIQVPGPDRRTETRLAQGIASLVRSETVGPRGWWQGWFGDTTPRPLVQKLAAAAMFAGLVGGGASAATGASPAEFARDTGSLIRSIVVNLNPGESGSPSPLASPSASPSTTPPPDTTTTPAAGATPPATPANGATPTQQPGATTTQQPGATATQQPGATPAASQTPASTGTPPAAVTSGPAASPSPSSTPDDDDSPDDGDDDDSSGSGNSGSGNSGRGSDDSPEEEDD